MPPIVFAILGAIQAAISLAPQVKDIAKKGKDFIGSLTGGGVITQAQQDILFARIDAISAAHADGKVPDSWAVEPDPE